MDRLVSKVGASEAEPSEPRLFGSYLGETNLILLGDPGSGKTYLMDYWAKQRAARFVTVRDFLNLPATRFAGVSEIFIDALDEKRSGRGDNAIVDALVSRLCELPPIQVRLSCRVADWLGATDLSALSAIFDSTVGTTVLSLEKLSLSEQIALLNEKKCVDPLSFLKKAQRRGLIRLLDNPQTLLMLYEQALNGDWPESKTELFSNTLDLLLSERNIYHKRRRFASSSPSEVRAAAGAAFAVLLTSDVRAISLEEICDDPDTPSYVNIDVVSREHLLAALATRAFVADATSRTFTYPHRTIAEFAAANWLAAKVRDGIPVGRVRRLLGFDGRPASELRGLHAWLAVLLHECSEELINADPLGVVTYSDAAALSTSLRLHVLSALAQLAEKDHWFAGGQNDISFYGLAGEDILSELRRILQDRSKPYGLRLIVLESVSEGPIAKLLQADFVSIVIDATAVFSERRTCIEILASLGTDGLDTLEETYHHIGKASTDIRVKCEILEAIYPRRLTPENIGELLSDAMYLGEKLPSGSLYGLDRIVPDAHIERVLRGIKIEKEDLDEPGERDNDSAITHIVECLIARVARFPKVNHLRLLSWLKLRLSCGDSGYGDSSKVLQEALSENLAVLGRIVVEMLLDDSNEDEPWELIQSIEKTTLGALSKDSILNISILTLKSAPPRRRKAVYEVALRLSFTIYPAPIDAFGFLYDFGSNADLRDLRERLCTDNLPEWRVKQGRQEAASRQRREADRANRIEQFEQSKTAILGGAHFGWISFLGDVYFALFSDLKSDGTPEERMAAVLGATNVPVALGAIANFAHSGKYSPVDEVVRLEAEGKLYRWWRGFVAGICVLNESGRLADVSDERLSSALAISALHPTQDRSGGWEHGWKKSLIASRPSLVVDVYMALAKSALGEKRDHVPTLYELTGNPGLETFRSAVVLELLRDYPNSPPNALQRLLDTAISDGQTELKALIPQARIQCMKQGNSNALLRWSAVGAVLGDDESKNFISQTTGDEAKSVAWMLRDFLGIRRRNADRTLIEVPSDFLEFSIAFIGRQFSWATHPPNGWVGNTNPWDATEAVEHLIARLSSQPTASAGRFLNGLSEREDLSSYRRSLLRATAKQHVVYVDTNFKQVSWQGAIKLLRGGAPVDIADLHAVAFDYCKDIVTHIKARNTDPYKRFWNLNKHSRIESPKPEDACRDALADLLQPRFDNLRVRVEPEGHMADDNRADINFSAPGIKLPLELKRDTHRDLWTAIGGQLDHYYTRDPEADGFGLYGVFWFGSKRARKMPVAPDGLPEPKTPGDLESRLVNTIPAGQREKIKVVVFDVSGPLDPLPKTTRRPDSAARKSGRRRPVQSATKSKKSRTRSKIAKKNAAAQLSRTSSKANKKRIISTSAKPGSSKTKSQSTIARTISKRSASKKKAGVPKRTNKS